MDEREDRQEGGSTSERFGYWLGQVLAVLLVVGLIAGAVVVVIDLYPEALPRKTNPSFVDMVFNSRIVIAAARIALLFAGG